MVPARRSVAFGIACAVAILFDFFATTSAQTPPATSTAGTFSGGAIAPSGLSIVAFTGTTVQLNTAGIGAKAVSVAATAGGKMLTFVVGAPDFVNIEFNSAFVGGMKGALVVVKTEGGGVVATPVPPVASPNPRAKVPHEFIGNAAVILKYPSAYDVHTPRDDLKSPVRSQLPPGIKPEIADPILLASQPGGFLTEQVLSDLQGVVLTDYDFALLIPLRQLPGQTNSGGHTGSQHETSALRITCCDPRPSAGRDFEGLRISTPGLGTDGPAVRPQTGRASGTSGRYRRPSVPPSLPRTRLGITGALTGRLPRPLLGGTPVSRSRSWP